MGNNETNNPKLKGNTMKNKIRSTRNFVAKHRVAIAVVTTTLVMGRLQIRTAAQFNEFLKKHGLFDEYYAMNEDA